MTHPGAAPAWEQALIFVFGPPIMSCLFWLKARGWALEVQGGKVSQTTKRRQKWEFWALLGACYLLLGGIFLYARLT